MRIGKHKLFVHTHTRQESKMHILHVTRNHSNHIPAILVLKYARKSLT